MKRDDRHGRLLRGADEPHRRPPDGFRARHVRRFRQLLADAVAALPAPAAEALSGARVEIRDVPGDRAAPMVPPWVVPLAEAHAMDQRVHRLVVYRRPAELRAASRQDLVELLRDAVLQAVADALGTNLERWEEG